MDFKLPELGEGVHEGELVTWRVKVGDIIKDDQPLCEIMTDKATIEIPSPFAGKVTQIHVKEGTVVKVGQAIISFDNGTGSATVTPTTTTSVATPAPAAPKQAPVAANVSAAPVPAPVRAPLPTVQVGGGLSVQAAPSTRRFAREAGVDLQRVSASGPGGRVLREDVERFLTGGGAYAGMANIGFPSATAHPTGGEERVPFKGLRKKIAEKMRISKDKAAHFTYVEEADATDLVKLRSQAKEMGAAQGIKVTYLPFIMKAMVAALKRYPILNSTLDETTGELVYKYYYNIGLSIQTDDGLTAPVVKNVEQKTILQLAAEIQDLVERARTKRLTMEDFKDGTITLTNAGSIGGLFATPIINFPEVAILGFNKIEKKPVVKTIGGQDRIVIRQWTLFSISLDHRIVDGAVGAEFMKAFIQIIETPSLLLMS